MDFCGFSSRPKRWHPKVARAAAEQINHILTDANIASLGEFWADFDMSTAGPPVLVEQFNSKGVHRIIRFAARDWSTVQSSIPDAINQLASVLVVHSRNELLPGVFRTAGTTIGHATATRERIEDDPNEHAMIMIASELTTDDFFSLVDSLETQMHQSRVGDVTGTGHGIAGWSIDLSAPKIEACIAVATKELTKRGLRFSVDQF